MSTRKSAFDFFFFNYRDSVTVILTAQSLQTYVMSRAVTEQIVTQSRRPVVFSVSKWLKLTQFQLFTPLWLKKGILQWEYLQEEKKVEPLGCPYLLLRVSKLEVFPGGRGGGGVVLPYITYTGMCRPMGLWFWSSWFRTGYPFQRRFLERGIIFRTHESSSFVSNHLK